MTDSEFLDPYEKSRNEFSNLKADFETNPGRVRILKGILKNNLKGKIIYWMNREHRVQGMVCSDNWSLIYAQELSERYQLEMEVVSFLNVRHSGYYRRHYDFMIDGLIELEKDLNVLNINYKVFAEGSSDSIVKYINKSNAAIVIIDLNPLPTVKKISELVISRINANITVHEVDGHNIVPVWVASVKKEFAARTIRPKINNSLPKYLTEFKPVKENIIDPRKMSHINNWNEIKNFISRTTDEDPEFDGKCRVVGGYRAAVKTLENFLIKKIPKYTSKRNDPNENVQSDLSPYFNFGFLSTQRAIIEVIKMKKKYPESVAAFCEEAIIRRELSDNLCYYSDPSIDLFDWIPEWGVKTLEKHETDPRPYDYTRTELEKAQTHDKLWNAAQNQVVASGKMHGFLRMYWCKKILEWTRNPRTALNDAIYLNNKFNIDGNDPNSITGCLWSIGGIHDRPWKERPIFGLIRYMNYEGCCRKFDVNKFIKRWSKH